MMARPKPPEKLAKGQVLNTPFDLEQFLFWSKIVTDVVRADRITGKLDAEKQGVMIVELTTAAGLAHTTELCKLPLVRHDTNGEPIKDKNGREIRPKLKPFKNHIFARDILSSWQGAGLKSTLYSNENGQSPLVSFATTLAKAMGIAENNKSMLASLRKAKDYEVKDLKKWL